jgi:hypothetical protein
MNKTLLHKLKESHKQNISVLNSQWKDTFYPKEEREKHNSNLRTKIKYHEGIIEGLDKSIGLIDTDKYNKGKVYKKDINWSKD